MKNENFYKGIIVAILIFVTFWFGIKPLILGTSYKDYTKINRNDLSFGENEYATIVVGSEPEGIASALACARTGLKTLLITKDNDLGSYISRSMISRMDPQQGIINKKKIPLNEGIYKEIFGRCNIGFSGDDYKITVKKLVEAEKSLDVVYGGSILDIDVEGKTIKGIKVKTTDNTRYYIARNFIDATFDGELLMLCQTPYSVGSFDLGMAQYYSPLEFNFTISGVDLEALRKSQKTSDFSLFQQAIYMYKKSNTRTKIVSPSFIDKNENELSIIGLKVVGVDVEDENDVQRAYKEAEEEAILLTAYLKNTMVAFEGCTYKTGPEELFIPEYRHFEGKYKLKVSDIFENKNFNDKIALCSKEVEAGKFINQSIEYIVTKPNVYAIPLGCIIPSNLDNVMMVGSKASFSSLASTSAGSLPTRITLGEAAGLVSAYSSINKISPYKLSESDENGIKNLVSYIKRGGITLMDFDENILIPNTEIKLKDHGAYPYVKTLVEYGIIAGSTENDFKLDFTASQELFAVLIKNAVIRMEPTAYNKDLEIRLKPFEVKNELTGEVAASIILKALSITYDEGKAIEKVKLLKKFPEALTNKLVYDKPITMDVVYGFAVEIIKVITAF